jgi:hypothetical protein
MPPSTLRGRWSCSASGPGRPPPLGLEHGHKATVCCHLANIAYLTKKRICWDGQNETILDDPDANALLMRPRRRGYELPSA